MGQLLKDSFVSIWKKFDNTVGNIFKSRQSLWRWCRLLRILLKHCWYEHHSTRKELQEFPATGTPALEKRAKNDDHSVRSPYQFNKSEKNYLKKEKLLEEKQSPVVGRTRCLVVGKCQQIYLWKRVSTTPKLFQDLDGFSYRVCHIS